MIKTPHAAFQRLALITGEAALEALAKTRVMVFGLGGVGSWCAEALVRSGVGNISLIDSDTVCVTNINRQLQATSATVGKHKTLCMQERLLEIHPLCNISVIHKIFSESNADEFDIGSTDYVIDAIDSLSCKIALIEKTAAHGKILYSSMGMAQKLDPTQLKTGDIWDTQGCPLARLVRAGLRKRNFTGHFTVVYSKERIPVQNNIASDCGTAHCLCPRINGNEKAHEWCSSKKIINGSAVPVTASAGMILAALLIQNVCAPFLEMEKHKQQYE